TDSLVGLESGEYYVSMTAKSTKAHDKGSVFYNVTATLEPSLGDALAMPESSSAASSLSMPEADSLGISDALSFCGYDTDVLADVSSLNDLNGQSDWLNLTTLA
ncbi:MAG: hypothetical protein IKX48_01795, partial [Victivallales bacterium]|nr:hypothetical protein [Victivallales bacterium]